MSSPVDYPKDELNVSNKSSSEEEHEIQQFLIKQNRIIRSKHKTSNERAFIDCQSKQLKENVPFTYSADGQPRLIFDSGQNIDLTTRKHLEHLSKLIVKIRVEFKQKEIKSYITGSGLIINDRYIITAAHLFNPLVEEEDVLVPYKRIQFTPLSYASDELFETNDPHVFEAELIIRGINDVGLEAHQICSDENDLAILGISKFEEVKDLLMSKNDKICSSPSLLEKNDIKVNDPLYLLAYCSTVRTKTDVEFYEECPLYRLYTREHLNNAMHPNHRTVSAGKCLACDAKHIVHDCPSLRGASGGVIVDGRGRVVGIHTGVRDVDVHYNTNGEKRLRPDALNQALAIYSDPVKAQLVAAMPK